MKRLFNIHGACSPDRHYMVNLAPKLEKTKKMVDAGDYFTINKARQYGKTTMLRALAVHLKDDYNVLSLDFQRMSHSDFTSEASFVNGLAREICKRLPLIGYIPDKIREYFIRFADKANTDIRMADIFDCFSEWCGQSDKPLVLIIDEVDTAADNQAFLDFLAQLRAAYLDRDLIPTFHSVILASVYDIRNMKRKVRPDEMHRQNSPWNIAALFKVELSFSVQEIAGMLADYETDYATGMDIAEMASLIYEYTAGYPFLVSKLCKLMDEDIVGSKNFPEKKMAWTYPGFLEAYKMLLAEKNTLFESLANKLYDFPELKRTVYSILFLGKDVPYNALNQEIEIAEMFGFLKNANGIALIANRIFEMVFYNLFLTSAENQNSDIYKAALQDKNQFIQNGHLNMDFLLERFVTHFNDLYGDCTNKFKEEDGRRYFLLYLRPIINGTGNYYIESRTRNMERTDVIIDFHGEQMVVELKIWRGDAYHKRGEEQLLAYLEHYHLKKGYMLSFNFNKNKETGIKRINLGDKVLIEAVV